jgi:hypothetical protein
MHVLVFATERAGTAIAGSPFVAIPDRAEAALPQHPDGLQWTYFATMAAEDVMLSVASDTLQREIEAKGHFIWTFPRLTRSQPKRPPRQPARAVG